MLKRITYAIVHLWYQITAPVMAKELIYREDLLAEYDRVHIGPPGGARKLIEDAPAVVVGKPLAEFLHPIDTYEGLKGKYLVFKADTGERVENCFVLRPGKDAAAVEALRTYAAMTDNKILSDDIYRWVGTPEGDRNNEN